MCDSRSATALAPVAAQMRIPAAALVALPTVVEVFAKRANMSEGLMIINLLENEALRDYAAQMCIKAVS